MTHEDRIYWLAVALSAALLVAEILRGIGI